jgi:hypothetical protein
MVKFSGRIFGQIYGHSAFGRIIIIITRFSCQAAVKAAKILPLVGLARSKQDPINRGHGAQYLYRPPPAGAYISAVYSVQKPEPGFQTKLGRSIPLTTGSTMSDCEGDSSLAPLTPRTINSEEFARSRVEDADY